MSALHHHPVLLTHNQSFLGLNCPCPCPGTRAAVPYGTCHTPPVAPVVLMRSTRRRSASESNEKRPRKRGRALPRLRAADSCRGARCQTHMSNSRWVGGGGGALGAGRCMGTTGAPHDVFDSCASPAHFPTDMCDLSTPRRCRVRLAPYSLSHPAPMVLVLSAGPEESPADWHLVYVRFRALTACGMQPCAPALEGRSDGWLRACHRPWRASGWLLAWELGSSTHRRHLSCWDNAVPRRSCASACPTVSDL